jgi:bla regulator protein BlaR1
MFTWLLEQQLWLSVMLSLLIVSERLLLPLVGARFILRLWWCVPLAGLVTLLPVTAISTFSTDLGRYTITPDTLPDTAWSLSVDVLYYFVALALLALTVQQHRAFKSQLKPFKQVQSWRSTQLSAPMVVGLLPARLVLPTDFEQQFSAHQQQLIMAHEHTHLRRCDNQFSALLLLGAVCCWFNPLVWFGFASFRRIQELACDEVVLNNQPETVRLQYGKALLHSVMHAQRAPAIFSQYGDKKTMQQRLTHLRDTRTLNKTLQVGLLSLAFTAVSVFALGGNATHDDKQAHAKKADQVRPIIRIEPKYPVEAAKNRIEGFVQLDFTIDSAGKTQDIRVLNAEPKDVFEKESIRALSQWEYTPNPNAKERFSVQLDYLMDATSKTQNEQDKMEQIQVVNW